MNPSAERLRSVLPSLYLEHETLPGRSADGVEDAIRAAAEASARRDAEPAWLCLKLADRLRLLSDDFGVDQLDARSVALRAETKVKLWSWRAATVADLLALADQEADKGSARRRTLLYEATRIRDEGEDNGYRRLALVRRNRTLLLPTLLATLLALIALVASGAADLSAAEDGRGAGFLVAVALFGALGGCISAIQSLGDATGQRIPEAMASATLTLARPVIGAAAAVGAYAVAEAGFPNLDTGTGYVLVALGFAAGFSERFVVRLVQTATK